MVWAAEGFPSAPRTGYGIRGLAEARLALGVTVFCAGVSQNDHGDLLTAGGRVLDVTAVGSTLEQARERAYEAVAKISWPGMQYRSDIASKSL